jgi:hypothetical protein
MSRKMTIFLTACILCLGIVSVNLVRIQAAPDSPSAGFSLPWWTVDSGGGTSQGDSYSLSGSIGQADAGSLAGGAYTLTGGFWSNAQATPSPTATDTPTPTATSTSTPTSDYTTFLPIIIH